METSIALEPLSTRVNNVKPEIVSMSLSSATINENGSVTVSGSFTDVGTQDTHSVLIDWGAGETSSEADP